MGHTILQVDFLVGKTVVMDIRVGRGHWKLKNYQVYEFSRFRTVDELQQIVNMADESLAKMSCDDSVQELCGHMIHILKQELATRHEIARKAQE
jgi:hypothetical protein